MLPLLRQSDIFKQREAAMQLSIYTYHDFFQHVPSYLLWKWVCIDVVGVECGEALDYNVGECRPG